MNVFDMVTESNRIEGIHREPTQAEIDEHIRFTGLNVVTLEDMRKFVKAYQPNAQLRIHKGLDVRVGSYFPPLGGEHIREQLQALLDDVNSARVQPWEAHVQYEKLHPFTDGNGRSGRALWYWMMDGQAFKNLGFLHAFYYQTLKAS